MVRCRWLSGPVLALACWVQAAFGDVLAGRVVGIADGDTVTVLDANRKQHRVRLAGIDAPEKNQPFGSRAKEHLSELAFGRDVEVAWQKRDRYGRIVGKVMVHDSGCRAASCPKTLDAGLSQIAVGLAWWYRKYSNEQSAEDRSRYDTAEQEAKAQHAELWSEPHPTPPWEWRTPAR